LLRLAADAVSFQMRRLPLFLNRKEGESMKTLAGHHWSAETLLVFVVAACLVVGAGIGLFIGLSMENIGVGISLGALAGLIIGVVAGVMISDSQE